MLLDLLDRSPVLKLEVTHYDRVNRGNGPILIRTRRVSLCLSMLHVGLVHLVEHEVCVGLLATKVIVKRFSRWKVNHSMLA